MCVCLGGWECENEGENGEVRELMSSRYKRVVWSLLLLPSSSSSSSRSSGSGSGSNGLSKPSKYFPPPYQTRPNQTKSNHPILFRDPPTLLTIQIVDHFMSFVKTSGVMETRFHIPIFISIKVDQQTKRLP